MQSVSLFSDIANFPDLQWKNVDVSRTQERCHVIHMFFGFSLYKVQLWQVSSLKIMCDRF